jgi:hypothetical protein
MTNAILQDPVRIAKAFNEWMRRYTDEPDQFQHQWETVIEFLADAHGGREPSYGETSTKYLHGLIIEQWQAEQVSK